MFARRAARLTPQAAVPSPHWVHRGRHHFLPTDRIGFRPFSVSSSLSLRWERRHWAVAPVSPKSSGKYDSYCSGTTIEEEWLVEAGAADLDDYYPVDIGDVFEDRYQVVGKLGYGSTSTVWFCRDIRKGKRSEDRYVAIKVCVRGLDAYQEVFIHQHINQSRAYDCEGQEVGISVNIQRMLESFTIEGPHGPHVCIVFEVMGMNLHNVRFDKTVGFGDKTSIKAAATDYCQPILLGLRHLHEKVRVVHAGIHVGELLLDIPRRWHVVPELFPRATPALLNHITPELRYSIRSEQGLGLICRLFDHPTPRKHHPAHTVYRTREMPFTYGSPKICDFSHARLDHPHNVGGSTLPRPPRSTAPEIMLDMPWSFPLDIWNLAELLWYFFQGQSLFSPARIEEDDDVESELDDTVLAQIVAFVGPPPVDFIRRSKKCQQFFREDGTWKGIVKIPEDMNLEDDEGSFLKGEDNTMFCALIRKMIQWRPEDRPTAKMLLEDEWFQRSMGVGRL